MPPEFVCQLLINVFRIAIIITIILQNAYTIYAAVIYLDDDDDDEMKVLIESVYHIVV